ncbi:nuclear transport factor 2 family protein [Yeosuana sp.]|uniref:nuclear transport factor 2 family protein n=1 Tax=Yeosuana sp. TaxID=2529388 RepID=UPI0040550DB6|tara:strand:+ start:102 stop:632 length:531 start_codon:yes stop_codon:yes gene_type:complete
MKKLFLLGLIIVLFSACQNKPERFTTTSPNIDVVKKLISDYEAGNWEAWATNYSDTAKIYHNTWKKSATPKETSEALKATLANTSSYSFDHGEDKIFFEQTIDDDGDTWVNFWGDWHGTVAANGQEIEIPVHLSCRMVDGKIANEYGFYDVSEFVLAMQAIDAAKATTGAEVEPSE